MYLGDAGADQQNLTSMIRYEVSEGLRVSGGVKKIRKYERNRTSVRNREPETSAKITRWCSLCEPRASMLLARASSRLGLPLRGAQRTRSVMSLAALAVAAPTGWTAEDLPKRRPLHARVSVADLEKHKEFYPL